MLLKNFILTDNNGRKFSLKKYQGDNYLLLVFFRGAWCNVCKKQLAEINALLKKSNGLPIKAIAVSNDSKLNSSILKAFLKLDFPVISDFKMTLINSFHLRTKFNGKLTSKPAIYIIEPKSLKIAYKRVSRNYKDRLPVKKLEKLLNSLEL